MSYGYPTVRNFYIDQSEPYLCVSHEAEREWVQPLRLLAGGIGGPLLLAASRKLEGDLSKAVFAIGVGMSVWSLSVYFRAQQRMDAFDGGRRSLS